MTHQRELVRELAKELSIKQMIAFSNLNYGVIWQWLWAEAIEQALFRV